MMPPPSVNRSGRRVLTGATFALSLAVVVHIGCGGTDQPLGNMPVDDTIDAGTGIDCTNGPNFTDCPCTAGETRACYTGPAATRGVGACKDGVQSCTERQELRYTFGACTGETVPTATNGGCVGGSSTGSGGPVDDCAPGECDPAIAAPRPLGPTSTGRVSSWRPTLRWELAPGTDGARVTLCHDRACTSIISILDADGTSVKASADLAPGVVYWRLTGRSGAKRGTTTGPTWQFVVGHKSAPVDASWGTMLDVNGDGYAEFLASAPGSGPAPAWAKGEGRLYVYQGGPAGVPTTPTMTVPAPKDGGYFGWSLASAGDVNGDGYADAIIGTLGALPGCGGGSIGYSPDQVWIYFGGPSGLGATPAVTLNGPNSAVGTCGVTCPNQACGPTFDLSCAADCDYFGSMVASGGDINGDGYADVLVGTKFGNVAYVYYGSATGVSPTPTKLVGKNLGKTLAGVGDVNGDGFADISVSGGGLFLYMGSEGGVVSSPVALLPGSEGPAAPNGTWDWDRGVDCAGDVNGDGYADVVTTTKGGNTGDPMGVPGYVYYGGPGGVTAAPAVAWSGGGMSASWLERTAGGGDLNGDGNSDVLWGGPMLKEHLGSVSGIQPLPAAESLPKADSVLGAGDLNGDGFDDAVVGSSGSAGTVRVYYGTATGLVPAKPLVLARPVADAWDFFFGQVVGGSAGL